MPVDKNDNSYVIAVYHVTRIRTPLRYLCVRYTMLEVKPTKTQGFFAQLLGLLQELLGLLHTHRIED